MLSYAVVITGFIGLTGPMSGAPLTLAEAMALAEKHSEIPVIARQRIERARSVRREAWSELYPSLVATGSYVRRSQELTREIAAGQSVVLQRKNALSLLATLALDVVDVRAIGAIRAASHGLDAESHDAAELQRALAFDVAESFYGVHSAGSMAEAARHRRDAAEATVKEAKERFEAGLAAKNETTRTELELAAAELGLTEAATGLEKTRLALDLLIGADTRDRPIDPPPDLELPSLDASSLKTSAARDRLDLRALAERVSQAEAEATIPVLGAVPRLQLQGIVAASNEAGFSGREIDGRVAAVLTWDIFDKGARYARDDALSASLEIARMAVSAKSRSIQIEVEQALLELGKARAALVQAKTRSRLAQVNAEEVKVLFASGLATALERVDALLAEYEAESELVRREVAVRVFELGLLRAIGAPLDIGADGHEGR